MMDSSEEKKKEMENKEQSELKEESEKINT